MSNNYPERIWFAKTKYSPPEPGQVILLKLPDGKVHDGMFFYCPKQEAFCRNNGQTVGFDFHEWCYSYEHLTCDAIMKHWCHWDNGPRPTLTDKPIELMMVDAEDGETTVYDDIGIVLLLLSQCSWLKPRLWRYAQVVSNNDVSGLLIKDDDFEIFVDKKRTTKSELCFIRRNCTSLSLNREDLVFQELMKHHSDGTDIFSEGYGNELLADLQENYGFHEIDDLSVTLTKETDTRLPDEGEGEPNVNPNSFFTYWGHN